jgi:hypothetical protein
VLRALCIRSSSSCSCSCSCSCALNSVCPIVVQHHAESCPLAPVSASSELSVVVLLRIGGCNHGSRPEQSLSVIGCAVSVEGQPECFLCICSVAGITSYPLYVRTMLQPPVPSKDPSVQSRWMRLSPTTMMTPARMAVPGLQPSSLLRHRQKVPHAVLRLHLRCIS